MPKYNVRLTYRETRWYGHDIEVEAFDAPTARSIVEAAYDQYVGGAPTLMVQGHDYGAIHKHESLGVGSENRDSEATIKVTGEIKGSDET